MTSLSTNLFASAERYPNRIALRCDDLQFTFAEFDAAAARVATPVEQAGIEPGDRVGVMLPNTPAFAIAFYGIMYRGAVAVPMNPLAQGAGGGLLPVQQWRQGVVRYTRLRRRGQRRRRRNGRAVLDYRRRRPDGPDR